MGLPRFGPPRGAHSMEPSSNLYVANCGPAVGLSDTDISSVFSKFGEVKGVYAADESGTRVVVSYSEADSARAALEALNSQPCAELGNRNLHIRYSVIRPTAPVRGSDTVPVASDASELNIPGVYLLHNFISAEEQKELLAAVDERPWITLSKRRVQHYGYEFCYDTRNVDTKRFMGELPSFVSPVLERIKLFPDIGDDSAATLDQLTVNEYPRGVGLSPHIDTHSAFEDLIFSLSLAGPCIMELRRYSDGVWLPKSIPDNHMEEKDLNTNYIRKAIYLPPRSMLLLSGEGRYAWHHYIPHHKIDMVNNSVIRRSSRRVSFTFRKVRKGPCRCQYPSYCDSQRQISQECTDHNCPKPLMLDSSWSQRCDQQNAVESGI